MDEPPKIKLRASERLHTEQRIRQEWVFKFIFENGTFVKSPIFHLWAYRDTEGKFSGKGPKLGLVVGRKTHLRAHVRNLWKRRMREAFRKKQARVSAAMLLLLQSRTAKKVPSYQEMAADLERLLEKTGSLKVLEQGRKK